MVFRVFSLFAVALVLIVIPVSALDVSTTAGTENEILPQQVGPALPGEEGGPDLGDPDSADETVDELKTIDELEDFSENVDVGLPQEEVKPQPASVENNLPVDARHRPRRYKVSNFLLGGFGGGCLGAGAGLLLFSGDGDGSLNEEKAKVAVPVAAGGGILVGGLLGMFLGATSEGGAAPPQVRLPGPQNTPVLVTVLPQGLKLDWNF